MDKRTLKKLELDKIIDMLSSYCVSTVGMSIAKALEPMTYAIEVNNTLDETSQALSYLLGTGISPMRRLNDVSPIADRASIGGILREESLLSIASFLGVSRDVRHALEHHEGDIPMLLSYAQQLVIDRFVENEIKRCILSEEEIADNASAELAKIRREINLKRSKIRDKMDDMLKSKAQYLQENIITIRDNRLVLSVKSEYKSSIKGLVHDVSSTGSTIFLEPIATVELNNEIMGLISKERVEIERILKSLSNLVMGIANQIKVSCKSLGYLDFIFAKGKLAVEMEATRPVVLKDNFINIVKGRHPLIPKDEVVPINIWIGKDFRQLIVTGPNTGGKTVSLKTTGLFVLMTQCGMLIPAGSGTCMPIFKNVYADIGDEQSIEQSLSTFSSHMTNIVSILDKADHESLVLLDELGAGTDPTEGAALGISILENLLSLGAVTLATTHYSEIKAFALTKDGVENAAMEFDIKTLSPTYKMGIGIPGKSNAFEISRQLGLKENIIKNARENISGEGIRFEDLLSSAERNRKASVAIRKEAESLKKDALKIYERAKKENKKIEENEQKLLRQAKDKASVIISDAKEETDKVIKRLKELEKGHKSGVNLDREQQIARDILRDAAKKHDTQEKTIKNEYAPKKLKIGETVKLLDADTNAIVLTMPNAKGQVQVQAGILKLTTSISNLVKIEAKKKINVIKSRGIGMKKNAAPLELDIRGNGAEEGIMELDLYLDNAFISAIPSVQIIHGKGSGVLRSAVHKHLKNHPHVKSFRLGRYGEGEAGVTVVEMKI